MDQIALEAGVVRATLYNHFRVKEALLDHYFRVEFETGSEALVGEVAKQLGLENQLNFLFDAFSKWAATKRAYLPYCLDYSLRLSTRQPDRPASSGLSSRCSPLCCREPSITARFRPTPTSVLWRNILNIYTSPQPCGGSPPWNQVPRVNAAECWAFSERCAVFN